MVNSIKPTVITGNAKTKRMDVINVIQTNTGMRMRLMPGARRLMIVTTKFNAAATEDVPSTNRLRDQKSNPRFTLNGFSVRFA